MSISRHARSGFSLPEIMIAIAIVGIMLGVIVPGYLSYLKKSKIRAATVELRTLNNGIESFYSDIGQYPETLDDLVRKPANEELAKDWPGPYVGKGKPINKDPWKNAYQYRLTPGEEHEYELYSYGPKGKTAPQAEWLNVWNQ